MRTQSLKNKQVAFDSVNKNPIRLYMTIAMMMPFASQRMVSAFMRQLLPSGKNGDYFPQGIYVFALCLSQFVIFLKLIRPLNTSQRLSSLKSSSTFAALCRPRPFLESLNALAVSSLGISTSKGIPRRRIICLKYRVIASDIERPRQSNIFLACSLLFASILVFIVVVIFILPVCYVMLLYIHRLYIKYTFLFGKKQCCLSIKSINSFSV